MIGFFGGTFSPPHNGHVHAARVFLEAVDVTKLLIIPTATPPHKQRQDHVSDEDRIAMCQLAFSDLPRTEISELEIKRGGKSYTADTISELSKTGERVAMLIGTDMFLTLDTWFQPQFIFDNADLYCVKRENDIALSAAMQEKNREYLARFGHEVKILEADALPSSSTDIRTAIQDGREIPSLPRSVAMYIAQRGLYIE